MPTDQVTLTSTELQEALGDAVTDRQLQSIREDHGMTGGRGYPTAWPAPTVRRLQVALALETAVSRLFRGRPSGLRALFDAVCDNDHDPKAPVWAVYRDGAVSYVYYPADVSRAVNDGGVVAKIERLWPEAPAYRPTSDDAPPPSDAATV